jgi:ATP phosphoribosyltransferase
MSALKLGIPSKGRLQEQTLEFFADSGLKITQSAGARGYTADLSAIPDVEVRLLSAGDIATALRDGELHAGVTGEDLLRELGDGFQRIALARALGFGRADLVVAVPAGWLDVTTMRDLGEVAAAHRKRSGRRFRVATKYAVQTNLFFRQHGIEDHRIVESLGATEGAPAAGAADIIVDITTTGATLQANQLRVLKDGRIMASQAQLAASRAADWSPEAHAALAHILDQMEARARGKSWRIVRATPAGQTEKLRAIAAEHGGRITEDAKSAFVFYCPAARAQAAALACARAGADPAAVLACDFIFDNEGRAPPSFLS